MIAVPANAATIRRGPRRVCRKVTTVRFTIAVCRGRNSAQSLVSHILRCDACCWRYNPEWKDDHKREGAMVAKNEPSRQAENSRQALASRAAGLREVGKYDEALAAPARDDQSVPNRCNGIHRARPNCFARWAGTMRRLGHSKKQSLDSRGTWWRSMVAPKVLREMGKHDEALAAFEETITRFPRDMVAFNGSAEVLREMGKHNEALAAFEETITRFPRDVVAFNGRAEVLREMGKHDEALAAFRRNNHSIPWGRGGIQWSRRSAS